MKNNTKVERHQKHYAGKTGAGGHCKQADRQASGMCRIPY